MPKLTASSRFCSFHLRIFEKFPKGTPCALCKTDDDGECILVSIPGTEDGGTMEATPVHTNCVDGFLGHMILQMTKIIAEQEKEPE